MNEQQTKQAIQSALKDFGTRPLADAAVALLETLGYRSQKRLTLTPNTADNFQTAFGFPGTVYCN